MEQQRGGTLRWLGSAPSCTRSRCGVSEHQLNMRDLCMAANGEGFLSVCRRGVASPRISGFLRMVRDQRPRGAPPFEKSTSSCQATARPMSDVRLAVGEGRTSQCVATPMPQDEDFEGLLATMMVKAAFPSALHSRICRRSPSARSLRRPPRMGSGKIQAIEK